MYAGFELRVDDELAYYEKVGSTVFNMYKKRVEEEIDRFMLDDGSINGTEMQSNWFPQIEADIFISHSHKDQNRAIALAGWLKANFGLYAFIDSCVWGYSDNLLRKIDDRFCKTGDGSSYDYKKRNYSTSHVHMMLSTALTMMIDKTECVFFLNTPNSMKSSDLISETESPWIYYEIGMTNLIRKKSPKDHRMKEIIAKGIFTESLHINYHVNLEHLHNISLSDLQNWENNYGRKPSIHPLDHLYDLKDLLLKL